MQATTSLDFVKWQAYYAKKNSEYCLTDHVIGAVVREIRQFMENFKDKPREITLAECMPKIVPAGEDDESQDSKSADEEEKPPETTQERMKRSKAIWGAILGVKELLPDECKQPPGTGQPGP